MYLDSILSYFIDEETEFQRIFTTSQGAHSQDQAVPIERLGLLGFGLSSFRERTGGKCDTTCRKTFTKCRFLGPQGSVYHTPGRMCTWLVEFR